MMNRKAARRARRARRIALTVALMALVAIVSIGATVAYLTANTQTITNTFTVGNIDLTLTETKGTLTTDANGKVTAGSYHMVPGNTIEKDPKVTVAEGSEECYLFVKVTESTNLDTFISYSMGANWKELEAGVYYYDGTITPGTAISVLAGDTVTVNGTVTKSDMDGLTDTTNPTLTFKAYAVQKANVADATAAWALVPTSEK